MPDISIIIVNWNTKALLEQCLRSIYDTGDDLNFEVIVVDNASTDSSPEMVQQRFPAVRLIENKQNLGFAQANNQALKMSAGRYALLLNSDTIVLPNALQKLLHCADTHSDAGVVGCKLLNQDGSLQESWASSPALWSELMGRNFRKRKPVGEEAALYEVDWVGGACMLVRSRAYEAVGLLDEAFFMYAEETDWCYRMKRHGWKTYYLAGAEIIHLGGGSAGRRSIKQLQQLYESKIYFFQKHYGPWSATLLTLGLAAAYTLRLIYHSMTWLLFQPKQKAERRQRLSVQRSLIKWLLNKATALNNLFANKLTLF